jgi:hypothetical protein
VFLFFTDNARKFCCCFFLIFSLRI